MMRKTAQILLLGALVFGGVLAFSSIGAAAPAQGQLVPGQYIVLTAAGVDPAAVAADHGLAARHTYRAALNGFAGAVPGNRLAGLQDDARVLVVEQERIYVLEVQELPTGIDRIEADKNSNANGVTVNLDVAIIDTGIDADHPDLNVAGGANFSGGSADNWNDGNGHGTHVGGTVGAIDNDIGVVGVAPGVRLYAVKVCKNGGICMTGDMVAGINWVADQKASGAIDFAVASMSISTSDDANECTGSSGAVHEAICGVVNAGVVFALAAGNDGREKAAFPEVLAVAALADFDGKGGGAGSPTCRSDQDDTLADFSNFGSTIDIAAPGVCILSTWNDGGLNTISGTSMATPHVAGAVALYLHANGLSPATDGLGVDEIEAAIISAALPEGTQNDACSYDNERGSTEPMLFVNGEAFKGSSECNLAGEQPPPEPLNDIAISAVNAPSSVTQGDVANVDVTVENVGNQDVTTDIHVTLTDDTDNVTIGTQTISGGLAAGGSTTLTYSWDTSGASLGDHALTASHDFADDDPSNDSNSTTVNVSDAAGEVIVTGITPDSMQAGTTVNVTISGSGFAAGASVTFENGSGPAPTASNVVVVDPNTITASVTARSGGPPRNRVWDVRVTNPDSSTGVLVDGFTVTP